MYHPSVACSWLMFNAVCTHPARLFCFDSFRIRRRAKRFQANQPTSRAHPDLAWNYTRGLFRVDFSTRRVGSDMDGGAAGGYHLIILIT